MDLHDIFKNVRCGKKLFNVSLKKYTTYKCDGIAKLIIMPRDLKDLERILNKIKEHNLKYKILGNGSNLIFVNEVYDGVLIKLDAFDELKIDKTEITVGAGYNLIKLAMKAANVGLTGLEFASGIPGTVGGACYMNAGAYKSDMGYVVEAVTVLNPEGKIETLLNKDLDYHYRSSFFQKNPGYIILEAKIHLKRGKKDAIMALINDRRQRRIETQPLEYPNAGSVFRNPEGDYAGRLIEECNLKGFNVNDAYISEKHANFIINKGNATGKDIKKLIEKAKEEVKKKFDIDLKIEQEFVE
ncbi:MAG: UDP-N-acetylmuramate dehydrogenase [Bacilli bacterium]|nr:UDP-N-acetylmuramate dehydrogenase [Bacilli bacterium]